MLLFVVKFLILQTDHGMPLGACARACFTSVINIFHISGVQFVLNGKFDLSAFGNKEVIYFHQEQQRKCQDPQNTKSYLSVSNKKQQNYFQLWLTQIGSDVRSRSSLLPEAPQDGVNVLKGFIDLSSLLGSWEFRSQLLQLQDSRWKKYIHICMLV